MTIDKTSGLNISFYATSTLASRITTTNLEKMTKNIFNPNNKPSMRIKLSNMIKIINRTVIIDKTQPWLRLGP
jgi:hypothetical protein